MTRNQIEYAKLLEQRRANLAQEGISQAKIRNDYNLGMVTAQEQQRHNVQTEGANIRSLDEIARHNRLQETISLVQAAENERYHTAQIENLRNQLQEQVRSNVARETEIKRSNLASEAELQRYHTASLGEQKRSNIARESQLASELLETQRYHDLYFNAEAARLEETNRSNRARETETNRSNYAREVETNRSNIQSEKIRVKELDEQKRHNIVTEIEKGVGTITSSGKDISNTINHYTNGNDSRVGSFGSRRSGSFGGSSSRSGSGLQPLIPSVGTGGNWSITLGGGYNYYGS